MPPGGVPRLARPRRLTGSDEQAALAALLARGTAYRAIRDELIPLVTAPSERTKGSVRDKKSWDVADVLNRVLARATSLVLDDGSGEASAIVVPLYDRLEHCGEAAGDGGGEGAGGANARLELDSAGEMDSAAEMNSAGEMGRDESAVLLVATREISAGEAITSDYHASPRLADDDSEGALRLLLQFGLGEAPPGGARDDAPGVDAGWAKIDEMLDGPAEGRREVAW